MISPSARIHRGILWLAIACLHLPIRGRCQAKADDAWATVPAILNRITAPTFPVRDFRITDFGAVEGGTVKGTKAFMEAISACAKAGGGRVVVPAGKFLTGPIHLSDNVELHLSEGAEIIFSDRFDDYLPPVLVRVGGIELFNYSPLIYARNCTNIAVTGKGKLNGNARAWWDWRNRETKKGFEMGAQGVPVEQRVFGTPEDAIRPSFLSFVSCTNILLSEFSIGSGPNWTIHPIYCRNLTVRGVHVLTDGPNNDGIDPDSCRDVLIEDCTFATGDDCVVLKSGYNEDGWRVGMPTENVIMRHCSSQRGHGGLVIGSEMSGGVRNVFMEDCEFTGTDRAIRIKSRADRGGVVENVFARNLRVKDMQREVVILNMDYSSDRKTLLKAVPPIFRNMRFENISANGAPTAILIQGLESSPIQNLEFSNLMINSTHGVVVNHAKELKFDSTKINPTEGAVFDLSNVNDVAIRHVTTSNTNGVFLKLAGTNSSGITIEAGDAANIVRKVVTGPGVRAGVVIFK